MVEVIKEYIRGHWDEFSLPFGMPEKVNLVFFKGFRKIIFYVSKYGDSRPFGVLKVGTEPVIFERLENEHEILSFLSSSKEMKEKVPQPISLFTLNEQQCLFETIIDGDPLVYSIKNIRTTRGRTRMEKLLNRVVAFLINLYNLGTPNILATPDTSVKDMSIVGRGIEHRDFKVPNMLISGQDIKVYDWEYSIVGGDPLIDLLEFSSSYVFHSRYLSGETVSKDLDYESLSDTFLSEEPFVKIIWENIYNYCNEICLERDSVVKIFRKFIRRYLDADETDGFCQKTERVWDNTRF